MMDEQKNIPIYLWIRNNGCDVQNLYEIDENILTSKVPLGSNCLRNVKEGDSKKICYTFTKIFDVKFSQRDIFDNVVKPKLLDFINGQDSSVLTYGVSGSVIGTQEEPGIIPQVLTYLFRTLPQLTMAPSVKPTPAGDIILLSELELKKERMLCTNLNESSMNLNYHVKTYLAMQQRLSCEPAPELKDLEDKSISVWVSFAEIYKNQIYDLLQVNPKRNQKKRLPLGMYNNNIYIKHLTSVNVTSGQEAYQLFHFGLTNLNYASTEINLHSRRSHIIFTIKLVKVSRNNECSISSFHICDLAGAEHCKKTHNVGDRLKESISINCSLWVLSRCISAVRDGQKQFLPFRESKLTQLFQKALSGNEDIAMIVNINPSREMFDESQHVLNFSAIEKKIIVEHGPKISTKKMNKFSQLVQQKTDHKDNEKLNLDYLRQGYNKLFKQNEVYVKQQIFYAKESVRINYKTKIYNLKRDYENQIRKLIKEKRADVIEIESSDDDEEEETETVKIKKCHLRQTLNHDVREYRHLQKKYKLLELENLKMREKICNLEKNLKRYRQQFVNQYINKKNDSESESDGEAYVI